MFQSSGMTGIAALAAAAAATQKIPGTTVSTGTPNVSGIKVVTPTIVTPSGMKVTPVQSRIGKSDVINKSNEHSKREAKLNYNSLRRNICISENSNKIAVQL